MSNKPNLPWVEMQDWLKHDFEPDDLLLFGLGNAKLDASIGTFSLPSGYTCPGASACLALAKRHPETGKMTLQNGPKSEFTCFSAAQELVQGASREGRWKNYGKLKAAERRGGLAAMVELIYCSIPALAKMIRIHVAGDFYSQTYFDAWCEIARLRPDLPLYAYTKSLKYWLARVSDIPSNLALVASEGGKHDALIAKHGLRNARVVFHPDEAKALNLEVDHTDALAQDNDVQRFALLLHGMQRKDTDAQKAINRMRDESITFSYNKQSKKKNLYVERKNKLTHAIAAAR